MTTRWTPWAAPALACGATHPPGGGRLDESARRLTHEELAVARGFASEGHVVRSLRPRRGGPRTSDLQVCGREVEVKSWEALGAGRDQPPTPRSVVNKLIQADGQAPIVVLYGRGSGLTAGTATAGMAEYARRHAAGGIGSVRVLGDGFDLGWRRDRTWSRSRGMDPPGLAAGR